MFCEFGSAGGVEIGGGWVSGFDGDSEEKSSFFELCRLADGDPVEVKLSFESYGGVNALNPVLQPILNILLHVLSDVFPKGQHLPSLLLFAAQQDCSSFGV